VRPPTLTRQVPPDWTTTAIKGVARRTLPAHVDERGYLRELWRTSWSVPGSNTDFAQVNLSHSTAGVLRGLHFHLRQSDLWVVLRGRAHVAVVDLRARLAGSRQTPTLTMELAAGDAVFIPEGVAHGFWALEDLDLLYLVTNEYDGTDELGFAWNDADAAVTWPGTAPLLSPRDQANQSLAEALQAAAAAEGR
jgi:dTDP-4-dehydrorhamnose 3,5-epimerase